MCQVSDKLKLCTCNAEEFDDAAHYWIFHRYVRGRYVLIMGETMLPVFIDAQTELLNQQTLLNLLNNGNPFDTDLKPKNLDRLSLHFTLAEQMGGILSYGFRYNSKEWVTMEYDPFLWVEKHVEAACGKIRNAIKQKTNKANDDASR